jgi:hypothetical protein
MSSFMAKRVSRSHTIYLNAEPGTVFSLFTPEEEKKWAPGWEYTPLFPPDGNIEKNLMFLTTTHDHLKVPAIWIVCNYKPLSYSVEYLRIEPDNKIGKIEIACDDAGEGKTAASVTYTYTSLGEEGNSFLETFTIEFYANYLSFWEKAINHYLKTGTMISE